MDDEMKVAAAWLIGVPMLVALLLGAGWFVRANFIAQNYAFAPAEEAVRRKTFEQSKSYRQGIVQEVRAMQQEYVLADDGHKAALRSIVVHRTSDIELSELPSDLASFVAELRGAK